MRGFRRASGRQLSDRDAVEITTVQWKPIEDDPPDGFAPLMSFEYDVRYVPLNGREPLDVIVEELHRIAREAHG